MVANVNLGLRHRTAMRALPLYGAIVGGLVVGTCVVLSSADALEALVWTTGIVTLVPMAAPPLGMTARVLLAVGGGVLVAALLWSSLFLLFGPGGLFAKPVRREDGMPVVRRADAHPDAPPRKPMSAADLGTPMMEVGIGGENGFASAIAGSSGARDERTIPVDLDQPLAAFDPKAILPVPMEPMRPVLPLAQSTMLAPVIEMPSRAEQETFVTAPAPQPAEPPVVAAPESIPAAAPRKSESEWCPAPSPEVVSTPITRPPRASVEPTTPPTIETLLQRLEQGALRRGRIGSH